MAKLSPFDFISAISSREKPDIMSDDPENEKAYLPFIINRQFSYFADTILAANMMNASSRIDNRLQFDFYRAIVRPSKRFAKWPKALKDEDVNTVVEYYNMSREKARGVLKILSKEAIASMRSHLSHGGLQKA